VVVLTILVAVFGFLLIVLWGCAGVVALFVDDAARRADAYKVLKLLAGLVGGSGGVAGLITGLVKLHELGVI
jgi:hypothetical protein